MPEQLSAVEGQVKAERRAGALMASLFLLEFVIVLSCLLAGKFSGKASDYYKCKTKFFKPSYQVAKAMHRTC
jgi:hypothetical protein